MNLFQLKNSLLLSLYLFMCLWPVSFVYAKSDEQIQHKIKYEINKLTLSKDSNIDVYVKNKLVLITGKVQLYHQKLSIDRIALTIPSVIEVDNEVIIVPLFPLSDVDIKKRIQLIIESDQNLYIALISIDIDKGVVFIKGSFLDFRDPLRLKSLVAKIEGVIDIRISSSLLIAPIRKNEILYKEQSSNFYIKL